jgi:FG-GAP-like repeat
MIACVGRGVCLSIALVTLAAPSAVRREPRRTPIAQARSISSDTFPSFDRTLFLETTSETSANVSIGDVNGDGHLDLVLVKGRHWPLVDRVLLGDGAGHFPTVYDLGTASDRSYSGRLIDIDGVLDIVAIDERTGTAIYFGRSNGSFAPGVRVGDGTAKPYALVGGDVNGDGKPDVIVGNIEAPSAAYLNEGTGRRFHVVHFGDNKGTVYGFALADLDGDGQIDIAAARSDAQNVVYFGKRAKPIPSGSR